MLVRVDLVALKDAEPLRDEAMQLTAIFSASRRTALARMRDTHGQQGDRSTATTDRVTTH